MASKSSCQGDHIDRCIMSLVNKARLEADMLGHSWVGSEHLVLSVIVTADEALGRVLHESGLSYERVKNAIDATRDSSRVI
jgi:ATP-dependent Clp protease ATP-binding subunit ClpA